MRQNVSNLDRAIRITIGLLLVAFSSSGAIGWWGYIGLIPVITGTWGYYPGYSLIKVTTRK